MLTDAWAWRLAHPHGYGRSAATDGAAMTSAAAEADAESGRVAEHAAGGSGAPASAQARAG